MTLCELNFKYFFMNKKRVVENNWKKTKVLKSLSKAVGPWKQKPQTHTSWTDFLQLTEEQMDQTADKKKRKSISLFMGEKLQLLYPVGHFPLLWDKAASWNQSLSVHHLQPPSVYLHQNVSWNTSSFVFLSSYNITRTWMDAFQRGITHSASPFSTSMWKSNSSRVMETETDDNLEPVSVGQAVHWKGL